MSRPRQAIPSYRCKKIKTSAGTTIKYGLVTLHDSAGNRQDVLLKRWNTPESKALYHRTIQEWEAAGRQLAATQGPDITIAEMLEGYRVYCERRYPPPSLELQNIRFAMQPLRVLYATLPAKDFGPRCLKALVLSMATGAWLTDEEKEERQKHGQRIDLARRTVAQRVGRIRRFFKWAVSEDHIPVTVLSALETVEVEPGTGRESKVVQPVSAALVEDTLPYVQPVVADIIRLLSLTGARVSEICGMKARHIEMGGPIWDFTPENHKTQRHGHVRTISLGPLAQQIIRRYLVPNLDAYLFSPAKSKEQFWQNQRAARKTTVPPSQRCRKRRKPKRVPGDRFDSHSVGHAIRRGVERLNAERAKQRLAPIEGWHVHQLRHSKGTDVRRAMGVEASAAVLGHATLSAAQIYAEKNQELARAAAAKLG
jgi:integrase